MGYYVLMGEGMEFYDVVLLFLEKDCGFDFLVLRVSGNLGKKWGIVVLVESVFGLGEGLMVIYYLGGGVKCIMWKECIICGVLVNDFR